MVEERTKRRLYNNSKELMSIELNTNSAFFMIHYLSLIEVKLAYHPICEGLGKFFLDHIAKVLFSD